MPRASSRTAVPRSAAPRDPEANRARILAAATREFAQHGLGGARVDRIAAQARTNKRMLYYYFGNKEALFLAVLEAAYAHIREAELRLSLLDVPPREGVRRLVEFTWKYYLDHPEFLTLLNTENLHGARHLKSSANIRTMNSPLIETLRKVLDRGARERVFRRKVDPLQLYISIAALGYFFLSNSPTLSAVFGRSLFTAAARAERLEHMTQMVLGYLAVPAAVIDSGKARG